MRFPLANTSSLFYKKLPTIRIEPTTYGLQNRCSTIEPSRQATFPILVKKKLTVKSFFLFCLILAFCLHKSVIYVYNTSRGIQYYSCLKRFDLMKKIILSLVGIVALAVLFGACNGYLIPILGTISWLPVIIFCDIPVYVLPATVLLTVILLLVGILMKDYKRFYLWYRGLLVFLTYSLIMFEFVCIQEKHRAYGLKDSIIILSFMLVAMCVAGIINYIETKQKYQYYALACCLPIVYLVVKYLYFIG